MSELLTIAEVAAATRRPVATLRYYRSRGEGPPSFRLGRRVLYRAEDVRAWIDRQYEAAQAPNRPGPYDRVTVRDVERLATGFQAKVPTLPRSRGSAS